MKFGSKFEYKQYLKDNHVAEFSHEGKKKTIAGSTVIKYGTS